MSTAKPDQVLLAVDDREVKLERERGSEDELGINIRQLRSDTGHVTLDYGFANTAACRSSITYVDGEAGVLHYRGYPIGQLAEQSTFLEVSYLLLNGELPTADQLEEFTYDITHHTLLNEEMKRFFDAFPKDAHPMGILSAATAAMSTFYQDTEDAFDPVVVEHSAKRLIAKLPTAAAFAHKKSAGQPYIYPLNDLDYASNFLRMMNAVPSEEYEIDPVAARALDMLFVLHADHEQNCSTATVRLVGSSRANLFASVAAGINALWGPLHGGANQAVVQMLRQIYDDGADYQKYIAKAKDREDPFRLMGFGHRVYRNFDPRALIISDLADQLLDRLGADDPLLDIARNLSRIAREDDYFIERKLFPNVDFYSGIIYRAIGFPQRMFPVLFAIGRLPGWIAQWMEMSTDPDTRIGRPRQIYVGETARDYVPIADR